MVAEHMSLHQPVLSHHHTISDHQGDKIFLHTQEIALELGNAITGEISARINEKSGLAGIDRMYISQVMFEKQISLKNITTMQEYLKIHRKITERTGFTNYPIIEDLISKDTIPFLYEHLKAFNQDIKQTFPLIEEIYIISSGEKTKAALIQLLDEGHITSIHEEQVGHAYLLNKQSILSLK